MRKFMLLLALALIGCANAPTPSTPTRYRYIITFTPSEVVIVRWWGEGTLEKAQFENRNMAGRIYAGCCDMERILPGEAGTAQLYFRGNKSFLVYQIRQTRPPSVRVQDLLDECNIRIRWSSLSADADQSLSPDQRKGGERRVLRWEYAPSDVVCVEAD